MLRSCVLPENEYENVNESDVIYACHQFYSLYEKLFSVKNCTYSVHVLSSHLLLMRAKGPLTSTSAFKFESFYGEMRRCFSPGTPSTLKQIMQKVYLKRSLSYHCCEKKIFYSPKDSSLEMNSLIYSYTNDTYQMYKIIECDPDDPENIFYCNVQGKIDLEFTEANEFDWSVVGVFKAGAIGNDLVTVERKDICGKVLNICSLLITCPNNVLREN